MSPDNPKQILSAHDFSNLRALQSIASTTTVPVATATPFGSISSNNNTTGMVLSTIPLDGHAVVMQHSHFIPTTATISQTHQQQRSTVVATTSNGLTTTGVGVQRTTAANSISNLIAAATLQPTKATIINTSNNNSINNNNNNNGINMPASSKYVFLQQNGNGQYTTYEGTTSTTGNNVGNIVLVATEPMELSSSNESHVITTVGDNDEELRPLSWLNDKNLIKGIVTTTTNAATVAGNGHNGKRGNICIVNANGTHEYIEELPPHVACEEHVTTISASDNNNSNHCHGSTATMSLQDMPETQITTLSVSDFQQQFITSNNIVNSKRHSSSSNGQQQLATLGNYAQAHESAASGKDQQHIYGNIGTLGATTTVHVGPSGTTTVVEYKSNSNYVPTQRQLINGINSNNNINSSIINNNNIAVSNSNNIATTITATNIGASLSNNNNNNHSNYVPSSTMTSSLSSASSTNYSSSPATSSPVTPLKQALTLPNYANTVVVSTSSVANGNNTANTIYQQQQKQSHIVNNTGSSATHHPHKKYLREKMNGLDQGAGNHNHNSNNNNNNSGNNSAATSMVSSPASSSSSNSTLSSSISTAAVNGANSPASKSSSNYYTLIGGGSSGGTGSSNTGGGSFVNYSNALVAANIITTPPTTTPNTSFSTQLNQNKHVITSPAMSSPESSTRDYYTAQTQPLLQQQHHIALKSPTSYSSYENDSLKDFEDVSTINSLRLATSTPHQQHQQSYQNHSPIPMHHQKSSTSPTSSTSSSTTTPQTPQKQKHPNNVPYDPLVHTHNKPPYSFSSLIFMAIEGSNEKALPVKEIYAWIVQHFPYFKSAPTGWKNSVRHNLSLNKSFVKVEKAPNMGKGSLWRVEQQQRQNLIQALTRSPFFPNSAVDKINLKSGGYEAIDISSATCSLTNGAGGNGGTGGGMLVGKSCIDARFDARLFPKLSKVFKDMEEHNTFNDIGVGIGGNIADDDIPSDYNASNSHNNNINSNNKYLFSSPALQQQNGDTGDDGGAISFPCYDSIERLARDCGADSIDDVNAATAMLALKHGPKVFAETFQNGAPVITSSPSEDHTYSAGGGGGGAGSTGSNLTNGNSTNVTVVNGVANGQIGSDNQSNCASSDAAYESSEENHNITPEDLVDQQRHRDGVDALLSLSLSSFIDGNSPIKRPPPTTVEEEHISSCMENITHLSAAASIGVGKMALISANASSTSQRQHVYMQHHNPHHHHSILDEGYNTQSYYGSNNNSNSSHYMATPSTPKKSKPLRNLRAKIKRKTTWIR